MLLVVIFLIGGGAAFAQETDSTKTKYPVKDGDNLSEKQKMRQWSYESYNSEFPAKRQNKWAVGVQLGTGFLTGDVAPLPSFAGAVSVRKALGHLLSIRAQFAGGQLYGRAWRPNAGIIRNASYNGFNNASADYVNNAPFYLVWYNHKTNWFDMNAQAVFNINNSNFYNKSPKLGLYVYAGVGAQFYQTRIDLLDPNGAIYDYSNMTVSQNRADKSTVVDELKALRDGEYETVGEGFDSTSPGYRVAFEVTGGAALLYRLTDRISLSLEHRVAWSGEDLIDGHQWSETNTKTPAPDLHQMATIGINFTIGKGQEPDWWNNPMQTLYSDVRDIKKKLSKGESDKDGDGVPDSKDKDNTTPPGALTDHHGVAIDSDQDGIPDFRDKEPFSMVGAQVGKDGSMLDSDNDRVPDIFDDEPNSPPDAQVDTRGRTIKTFDGGAASPSAPVRGLPLVHFDFGTAKIKREFYPALYRVATTMHNNPNIDMRVVGHADKRNRSGRNEALSRRRAQNCVEILVRTFGVDRDRFSVQAMGSDALLVDSPQGGSGLGSEDVHYLNRRVEFQVITR